ncbi:MAG TPA: hypothetical protein VN887_19525, partial [Candidatus Angelobacter sp.]|nr:hypothetical protein [Candidatus Angelobacter sp.]
MSFSIGAPNFRFWENADFWVKSFTFLLEKFFNFPVSEEVARFLVETSDSGRSRDRLRPTCAFQKESQLSKRYQIDKQRAAQQFR